MGLRGPEGPRGPQGEAGPAATAVCVSLLNVSCKTLCNSEPVVLDGEVMPLPTVEYNNGFAVLNPYKLHVRHTGFYLLNYGVRFAVPMAGAHLALSINGEIRPCTILSAGMFMAEAQLSHTSILQLAEGDVLEMHVYGECVKTSCLVLNEGVGAHLTLIKLA